MSHPTSSGSEQQQRQWLPLDEIEREMVRECFVTENQREGWAALKEYRSSVLEYKKAETMTAELCPFCGQQAVRRPAPDIPRLPKRTDPDPVTADPDPVTGPGPCQTVGPGIFGWVFGAHTGGRGKNGAAEIRVGQGHGRACEQRLQRE